MRYPSGVTEKKHEKIEENNQIRYCLYARKSSESDERQAMSIESQINEMKELAERENLLIKEIRQESHSAKLSAQRPVFNQLLLDIRSGQFDGILTWAPDRLSRNAGDLGTLVDLMDQGKLQTIKTYSQSFSDNPNEKFLLMILCSQAKLENDNRGINVKRGLRAKCEAGWRPGAAPVGYINRLTENRIAYVDIDPQRAPIIKEIFERVVHQGHSGRTIKYWLDKTGFKTRAGKRMSISEVYRVLRKHFYYGEFEFPEDSGHWYKGKHPSLISKELFNQAQKILAVPPRDWSKKDFPFKMLLKCGQCGASITAEEKFKKLINGKFKRHVYYHCTRSVDYDCDQPYITEDDLVRQLLAKINDIEFDQKAIDEKMKQEIERYHRLRSDVLHQEIFEQQLEAFDYPIIKEKSPEDRIRDYIIHVLKTGFSEEKQEILTLFKTRFILMDKELKIDITESS